MYAWCTEAYYKACHHTDWIDPKMLLNHIFSCRNVFAKFHYISGSLYQYAAKNDICLVQLSTNQTCWGDLWLLWLHCPHITCLHQILFHAATCVSSLHIELYLAIQLFSCKYVTIKLSWVELSWEVLDICCPHIFLLNSYQVSFHLIAFFLCSLTGVVLNCLFGSLCRSQFHFHFLR